MYRKLIYLVVVTLVLAGPAYAQVDKDTILGAWLLDEGSGDVAADASGNGHDGTLMGSPNWVAGRYGTALAFSGSGTYVDCGNPDVFNVDIFSVSFWCYIPNIQYWNHMISRGSHVASGTPGSVNWGVMMYDQQETILYETFNDTGWVGISTPAAAGEWHHVVATLDVTAMQLYLDGALAGSASGGTLLNESRPFIIGARSDAGTPGGFFDGSLDDVGYFGAILTPEDIEALMNKGLAEVVGGPPVAGKPQPANGQTDAPRDPVLSWTAGKLAATHNVYFSDNLDEVSTGSPSALIADGITETSVTPGRLAFESTYYWRVDEVNAAPDYAVFEGAVWSFTVEPFVYPIEGVIATSNGNSDAGAGPENTVNGSGLNANGEHSIAATDMWLTVPGAADALWIQYEFDGLYKLHEMLVWNYNVQFELVLGFGLKDVTVEYSENGTDWTVLGDVEFAQATATANYTANTVVDLQGVAAKYVRLNVNSGHGPLGQFGLSEVRFMFIPVVAREPQPDDGAAGVSPDAILSWRAGREVANHEVYLGTAPDALALADTVSTNSYTPPELTFGTAYHWRIDEVNEAEVPSVWASNVWTFSTQEYAVIDDMESYDDEENRIFDAWLDGFANGTGATVGYFEAPFAERSIVNSGAQSMPLEYNNTVAPFYSEAEYDLGSVNLNAAGANTLRLFVSGQAPPFLETADGTILMNAIGYDIWDMRDEGRYAYKQLNGDGSIIARVDSRDASSNGWMKVGVMIRQSADTGSQHAFMCLTGGSGNGYSYQRRIDTDGTSTSNDGPAPAIAPPYWVRIERAGNVFTASVSPDGAAWVEVGTAQTIAMTDPVLIGLALTSHNRNQATGAALSNVSTTGNVTGDWQVAELGTAQPTTGNDIAPLYVALEDTSGNVAVATHPDANIVGKSGWNEWLVPYSDLAGVNLGRVATLYIGVGDRDNPSADGSGLIFIDDIGYGAPLAPAGAGN